MEVSGQMLHLSCHVMPAVPVLQDELCTRDSYLWFVFVQISRHDKSDD